MVPISVWAALGAMILLANNHVVVTANPSSSWDFLGETPPMTLMNNTRLAIDDVASLPNYATTTPQTCLDHCVSTVRVFRQRFKLEDVIGLPAFAPLEVCMRATNDIPLGWSLLLPVVTIHCVQTLKASHIVEEWCGSRRQSRYQCTAAKEGSRQRVAATPPRSTRITSPSPANFQPPKVAWGLCQRSFDTRQACRCGRCSTIRG
jgi:hypothetical protein